MAFILYVTILIHYQTIFKLKLVQVFGNVFILLYWLRIIHKMPKPSYNISPLVLNELKKEVLKMASFPIRTKSDAGYLALLMKRMGIDSVSESTILRFLNQPENDHKFYLHTLDKFAVFSPKSQSGRASFSCSHK